MEPLPAARFHAEALHSLLCQRIAQLHRPVVADVMGVFLEVSSLAREQGLWSLEFAFDEDDGRIARVEARLWDPRDPAPVDGELPGYEVLLALPRLIPVTSLEDRNKAADHLLMLAAGHDGLVARFVRALTDLGAYRGIEPIEALSAEAHLL